MFKLFSLFMVVAVNPGAADCNKNQTCFQQGRATKMMQKTKRKLLDSQVQIDEKTQTTLEALEVLKMQMFEKVPWTKEDKQKFSAALQELNTSFTQALQAEHDADESEWKAEKTKQETCHSEAAKRFQNVVAINNGNVADLREKHKRCRKVDKSWSEYENTATTCKSVSSVTLPTNSCPDDIKDKIVIVQTDQAAYRNAKPKTEDGEANPSNCNPDQRAFEESFCLWRSSHHYACLAEETCVTTIDLPTTKQRLQQRSESRRGVTTSTRITFCKMEHLVEHGTANGTTNTDNCDGLVLPTDYLRLNLVVPVTKHCTTSSKAEYSTYPSSSDTAMCADWKSAEYSSWAAESYVIPDACHGTCSVDPVSEAPTPAPPTPSPPTPAPTPAPPTPAPPTPPPALSSFTHGNSGELDSSLTGLNGLHTSTNGRGCIHGIPKTQGCTGGWDQCGMTIEQCAQRCLDNNFNDTNNWRNTDESQNRANAYCGSFEVYIGTSTLADPQKREDIEAGVKGGCHLMNYYPGTTISESTYCDTEQFSATSGRKYNWFYYRSGQQAPTPAPPAPSPPTTA